MASALAVRFSGLGKSYGGRRIVGPLDLVVAAGEFVAILGPSGCGKTTTLKMINGLIEPDQGTVALPEAADGEDGHRRRRRIGYVFQEVGLFPHMSIGGNIAVGPRLAGWDRRRIAERIHELLALVALPQEVRDRLPAELSGGQRQRVGLARALAAGPTIMLLDEPFGALDPLTRDRLGRDYRALHERLGLTTIMVTHDVLEALLLADRLVVMDAGDVIADGTPARLLRSVDDERVRQLMDTPRRQAARLASLAADPVERGA